MFNKGMFSFWQYLLSILPKADAAAVLIMPFPVVPLLLHFLYTSMNPMTVIGLITPDAADSIGTSSSMTQTFCALATVNCDQVPCPVLNETFFPTR
jgi:hypothetical protein